MLDAQQFLEHFGERLRTALDQADISNSHLARLLDVSPGAASNMRLIGKNTRQKSIDLFKLFKLCTSTGINPNYLLLGTKPVLLVEQDDKSRQLATIMPMVLTNMDLLLEMRALSAEDYQFVIGELHRLNRHLLSRNAPTA